MLVKVIKKVSDKTYKNKEGKERHYTNFYLVMDNGKLIPINPVYNIKSSYDNLNLIADLVKD